MVYGKEPEGSGGFVACILVNGMPVTERADGVIELPFETEYQIRLRNKTDKDSVAKIYIDDELITPQPLIIRKRGTNGNDFIDLDCNIATRKKFKFVAVDSFDAIDHGKNRPDDPSMGVIKVEFYTERDKPPVQYHQIYNTWEPYGLPRRRKSPPYYNNVEIYRSSNSGKRLRSFAPENLCGAASNSSNNLESGATVEGGQSSQNFGIGWVDIDWSKPPTVVRLTLKGYWVDEASPIPVQQLQLSRHCTKCGAKRKRPSAKFCEMCGTNF